MERQVDRIVFFPVADKFLREIYARALFRPGEVEQGREESLMSVFSIRPGRDESGRTIEFPLSRLSIHERRSVNSARIRREIERFHSHSLRTGYIGIIPYSL